MVANTRQSDARLGQPTPADSRGEYTVPGLPALTAQGGRFVTAFIESGFDLPAAAAAAGISTHDAYRFAADSNVQAHVEAHFKALHIATKCKAAVARRLIMDQIPVLLAQATDLKEKRLLLQQLLRATTASIIPAGLTRSPAGPARDKPETEADHDHDEPELPRPYGPALAPGTAHQVFAKVMEAINRRDFPEPDSGPATIAALLEHDAEIDGEPVETDNPEECLNAVLESDLPELTGYECPWGQTHTKVSDSHEILSRNIGGKLGSRKVTIELTKAKPGDTLSRQPGRWLLKKITTSPADPWPPGSGKAPWESS